MVCQHQKEPLAQAGHLKSSCKRLLLLCKTEHCNTMLWGQGCKVAFCKAHFFVSQPIIHSCFLQLSRQWKNWKEHSYFSGLLKTTFHIITARPLYWAFTDNIKWGSAAYCAEQRFGCSVFSRQKAALLRLGGLWSRSTDMKGPYTFSAAPLNEEDFSFSAQTLFLPKLRVLALCVQIGVVPYLPG